METLFKEVMWKQFGASIDMFENAVRECPEELWDTDSKYWYIVYHTLFFLDYYLTKDPDNFFPPPPFNLSEFDPDGEMPERVYTKEEMITYLDHCRNKCHDLIAALNADTVNDRWTNEYRNYSIPEILLYNMRHVQHHGAQLNLLLRQNNADVPDWVSQTKIKL